ncbi:MAG: AlpA family transcriptional regulator [Alphaproteobacteria bacterium]|nr:AlpA family transcriptional regulator [Alphaproteobacteria bacterium]
MSKRFIRLKEVIQITGLARSTIYAAIKDGSFPSQIKLTQRAIGWSEEQVFEWVGSRLPKKHENGSQRTITKP